MSSLTINNTNIDEEMQVVLLDWDISYADGHWTKGRNYVCAFVKLDEVLNLVSKWVLLESPVTEITFKQWIEPETNPKAYRIKWLKAAGNVLKFQNSPENNLQKSMILSNLLYYFVNICIIYILYILYIFIYIL